MKFVRFTLISMLFILLPVAAFSAISTSDCVSCHMKHTPGIVSQFHDSAMGKKGMDCADCHGTTHKGMDDVKKAKMPTAETCGTCHQEKLEQFKKGKHNLAWFAMKSQHAWHGQPGSIVKQGYRGCSGCHKMGEKGLVGIRDGNAGALKRDGGKEAAEYKYGNAQCDACHTRHNFKKAEAKDPRSCSNCHMGFDHPQYEMYTSSKHGIAWSVDGFPTDGRAPTCQKCHMADGDHEVTAPWGFLGLRIPTKENVLALIKVAPSLEKQLRSLADKLPSGKYDGVDDDPQWTLDRALYLQAAGVLDDNLQPTERFVEIVVQGRAARGPAEFNALRAKMKKNCTECHASDFVQQFFNASDDIIKQIDHEFAKAIAAVQGLYKDGILQKPAGWKFAPDLLQYYDVKTGIEQDLYLIFLEHRQRAFQGAFHVSNDYMHWYGWAPLKETVNRILEEEKKLRAEHKKPKK
ncbi:MAG: cytochrome C [Nitrospirae bacterium]|nr:cytochrome C [Nitrospirota bacterium]